MEVLPLEWSVGGSGLNVGVDDAVRPPHSSLFSSPRRPIGTPRRVGPPRIRVGGRRWGDCTTPGGLGGEPVEPRIVLPKLTVPEK